MARFIVEVASATWKDLIRLFKIILISATAFAIALILIFLTIAVQHYGFNGALACLLPMVLVGGLLVVWARKQ